MLRMEQATIAFSMTSLFKSRQHAGAAHCMSLCVSAHRYTFCGQAKYASDVHHASQAPRTHCTPWRWGTLSCLL